MGDSFAFALPVTTLAFACAFLLLWRWGARAGLSWALGFLFDAAGYGTTLVTSLISDDSLAIIADGLFLLSFFFFGQGLLQRMGRSGLVRTRLAIVAVGMALSLWSVLVVDSLHVELVASEVACAALIALPLGVVGWRRHPPLDRILLALAGLVILDCLIRAGTVLWTAPGSVDDFASTEYAFIMQATGFVLSDVFALTGMAAMALDLLSRYRQEASTDPLSGLLNRRGFEEAGAACQLNGQRAGVVTCDIDHFKRVNDRFGHAAGDAVIRRLADIIRDCLPPGGIAARFGGEEFVLLLPECAKGEAQALAETVRQRLAEQDWQGVGIAPPLTASFGVSGTLPTDFSLHDSIARADAALYEAKRSGRNRVAVKLSLLPLDEPVRTGPADRNLRIHSEQYRRTHRPPT